MGMHVNFDDSNLKISSRKLEAARYALGNQIISDMDKFVPYKNGDLANSVHLTSVPNGVRILYTQPYARRQFYGVGIKNYTRSIHPLATKRWDLKAKSLYMLDWVHAFTKGSGL